jgi:hypothetical protein
VRGRAVAQRHNQKDFFDTNSHAEAAKEEKFFGQKKAIAFADPFAKKEIIASDRTGIARAISHSFDKKEKAFPFAIAECVTEAKEKIFANARADWDSERHSISDRDPGRIAIAECVTEAKEEIFADARAD